MNYLAHAYLSFNNEQILLGNMCSDFIKGKKKFDYAIDIQKGIALHRAIDTFTDAHATTAEAKQFFKPAVGLYAGAFVDVVYDHFLAIDTKEFYDSVALEKFSLYTYTILQQHIEVLPLK
jgi:acyl carrier protein phosphodiesterase